MLLKAYYYLSFLVCLLFVTSIISVLFKGFILKDYTTTGILIKDTSDQTKNIVFVFNNKKYSIISSETEAEIMYKQVLDEIGQTPDTDFEDYFYYVANGTI